MMEKKAFEKSLLSLLYFKNVKNEQNHTDFLYNLLKDDFTNEEFNAMCAELCKKSELFGKYPDPKLFYDLKEKEENTILVEVGTLYIDHTTPEYAEVLKGLSFDDSYKLCMAVWDWLYKNKRGELVSVKYVADRLRQFRPKEVEPALPESIGQKLLGAIKKI